MLTAGTKAPNFSTTDQNGVVRSLSDYKGSWILLYFYPKDDTPGCTAEACEFRDSVNILRSRGITILGVSADNEESHKKFGEKYALTFSLLADTEKKIVNAYEVWGEKTARNKSYWGIIRTSFLINPDGIIHKVYERVKPEGHAEEVVKDTEAL